MLRGIQDRSRHLCHRVNVSVNVTPAFHPAPVIPVTKIDDSAFRAEQYWARGVFMRNSLRQCRSTCALDRM